MVLRFLQFAHNKFNDVRGLDTELMYAMCNFGNLTGVEEFISQSHGGDLNEFGDCCTEEDLYTAAPLLSLPLTTMANWPRSRATWRLPRCGGCSKEGRPLAYFARCLLCSSGLNRTPSCPNLRVACCPEADELIGSTYRPILQF